MWVARPHTSVASLFATWFRVWKSDGVTPIWDGSVGAAQLGLNCFALDDNTVTALGRATGATVQQYAAAGQVVAIDPSGQVWVDFWHQSVALA